MLDLCRNNSIDPQIFSKIFLSELSKLVDELEALETPQWAAFAIMDREICTRRVIDPNCGTGVLADAARCAGYEVFANDIFNWGYEGQDFTYDFLSDEAGHHLGGLIKDQTVFMNPPFKYACDFLKNAAALGARKVILFQNISWYTSKGRKAFWHKYKPSRIYIFAERATTWRFDIPEHERKGVTSKTFAFFVWDGWDNITDPTTHLIYKGEGVHVNQRD